MWWCQHCSWHCKTFLHSCNHFCHTQPCRIQRLHSQPLGCSEMWKNHGKTLLLCFWWTQISILHVAKMLIICKEEQINVNLTKWALTNVDQVLYGHENRVSALKVSLRNSLNCIACFLSSYVCWRPLFSLEIEHLIQISKKVKEGEGDFENCWCIAKRFCQTELLNFTFSLGSLPLANISQIYCQLNHPTIIWNFYQPKYLICPYFSN